MTHLPFGFETRIFIFIFISKIGFIEQPRILLVQLSLNLKLDSLHQLRFIRQDQSLRAELVDITSKMGHHLTQTGLQVYKIKWAGWWKDTFSYGPVRVIYLIHRKSSAALYSAIWIFFLLRRSFLTQHPTVFSSAKKTEWERYGCTLGDLFQQSFTLFK